MFLCGNRELLAAFRRGDRSALASVYEHYYPAVVQMVTGGFAFDSGGRALRYRGARSSPDLFDLVHDVFTALFEERARAGYGGTAPYGAYVAAIARNRIISRLRTDKARLLAPSDGAAAVDEADASGALSPEEVAIGRQMDGIVRRYVDEQSETARALLRCRFTDDLSQEATAAALGLSRKQVRRLEESLRRGLLRRLRSHDRTGGAATSLSGLLTGLL